MPKKDKDKEAFGNRGIERDIETTLDEHKLNPDIVEKIKLQLNKSYREKIQSFKQEYNEYSQAGRFFTSTQLRRIKKRDWVCFIDCEADILIIERVVYSDGTTLQSNSYEYPVGLTKTIEMQPSFFSLRRKKIIIHLCIANTYALEISNHMKGLTSSVFLKAILKTKDRSKLSEKPLLKMILSGFIFGIIAYFVLIQVFEEAIINMIGQFQITPPET